MQRHISIIGIPRCGTTLLGQLLRSFPKLQSLDWGRERALIVNLKDEVQFGRTEPGVWLWRNPTQVGKAFYHHNYNRTVPHYSHMIAMVRDLRDCYCSNRMGRKLFWYSDKVEKLIEYFRNMRDAIERDTGGKIIVARYEDLCQNPRRVLKEIGKHCDLGVLDDDWMHYHDRIAMSGLKQQVHPEITTRSVSQWVEFPERVAALEAHPEYADLAKFFGSCYTGVQEVTHEHPGQREAGDEQSAED